MDSILQGRQTHISRDSCTCSFRTGLLSASSEINDGLIEFFDLPMSVATRGPALQPNIRLQLPGIQHPVEVASGICYEIAYGDTLRRQAATSASRIIARIRSSICSYRHSAHDLVMPSPN